MSEQDNTGYSALLTVDEFHHAMSPLVHEFQYYWHRKHEEEPENYPETMEQEDWWENFTAFVEMSAEERRVD